MALYGVPSNDFERAFYNQNPEAGFWRYLMNRGWGGSDPTSAYGQRQYNRQQGLYTADAASNPNMGFYDYLVQRQPDFYSDFSNQAPSQRGDSGSVRYAPRVRYVRGY